MCKRIRWLCLAGLVLACGPQGADPDPQQHGRALESADAQVPPPIPFGDWRGRFYPPGRQGAVLVEADPVNPLFFRAWGVDVTEQRVTYLLVGTFPQQYPALMARAAQEQQETGIQTQQCHILWGQILPPPTLPPPNIPIGDVIIARVNQMEAANCPDL